MCTSNIILSTTSVNSLHYNDLYFNVCIRNSVYSKRDTIKIFEFSEYWMEVTLPSNIIIIFQSDLIRSEGYTCEIHEIHTTDGYILEIHRIPPKVHKPNLKPVLLAHGLLFSSSMYVINGRNSFAFYLADLGYDVWMFNHRGNGISRKHEILDYTKDRKEFFNYT